MMNRLLKSMALALMLCVLGISSTGWLSGAEALAATIQLPRTGQTGCWDVNGNAIACTGTGQDGDKLKGAAWPATRFTNQDGTAPVTGAVVVDQLTGLMWSKDANLPAATKSWQQALDYVSAMNSGAGTFGYTDWRLPNRKELFSLLDRQRFSPALPSGHPFSNVQAEYWTSDTDINSPVNKWTVSVSWGWGDTGGIVQTNSVLPVRGPGFPIIGISPATKDFGSVATNATSGAQAFTISNTGTASLLVSGIATTGGDSTLFTLTKGDGTAGTCGATPTIAPAGSCTVSATFIPTSAGAKATTLRVASNDPATTNKDVALTGTGVLPTYTISTSVVGGNGSITCDSPVNQGATSVCIITPSTGYRLATFADNAADKLASVASGSYTISNVQAAHAIQGTFVLTFTVTPDAASYGVISPATPQTVNQNATTSFTITPTTGYAINTVTGCNGTLNATTYTTGAITGAAHSGIITPAIGKAAPDINDALQVLQHFMGTAPLSAARQAAADAGPLGADGKPAGDGTIDVGDVVVILRRIVGASSW